ncbi:hypothetical protein MEX01_48510 [Methylorubrum extorquens]|uniref:hypothetical protein n=1 Tax=Methylorubrum extorquens TaxID=408 RepID=UPI00116F628E|nr:hypothetical protein [Methylorubrum extorquens]GEL44260.1 hypothetical protein MEX01_48510 [Methylorubrum extorquens]
MTDAPLFNTYLVGNGRWCSTCFPDGPPVSFVSSRLSRRMRRARAGCNECRGEGRIVFTAEEIVAATVAEARAWRERAA